MVENNMQFVIIYIFIFSENDVALILKYVYSDSTEPSGNIKKRKFESVKNIMDFSQIKLPALMFLKYTETYLTNFIDDCHR